MHVPRIPSDKIGEAACGHAELWRGPRKHTDITELADSPEFENWMSASTSPRGPRWPGESGPGTLSGLAMH